MFCLCVSVCENSFRRYNDTALPTLLHVSCHRIHLQPHEVFYFWLLYLCCRHLPIKYILWFVLWFLGSDLWHPPTNQPRSISPMSITWSGLSRYSTLVSVSCGFCSCPTTCICTGSSVIDVVALCLDQHCVCVDACTLTGVKTCCFLSTVEVKRGTVRIFYRGWATESVSQIEAESGSIYKSAQHANKPL